MPQFVSPGVYVLERDFSDYVAALGQTAVGMVGTAKRGPINTPTFCSTPEAFLTIFGEPNVNQYGPYAALNYLRRGNQLYYVRVAKQYVEEVGIFSSYSVSNGVYTIVLTEPASVSPGNWIRLKEPGLRTSWGLKVTSVDGATLTLSTDSNSRLTDIENYTSGVAVIDLDESSVGGASNSSEAFAVNRYDSSVSDVVKFTAVNSGEWANYGGTTNGIEIVISDGGAFKNIDPVTNATKEWDDGTSLEGILPSAASLDSPQDLFALTSVNATAKQMRGVNHDFFNTAVVSISSDSSDALFEVSDGSFFTPGDAVMVNGSTINSSSSYDNIDLYVQSVDSSDPSHAYLKLATLSGSTLTVTGSTNNGGNTLLTTTGSSASFAISDNVLVVGTSFAGVYPVTSVAGGITIDLPWSSSYASSSGSVVEMSTVAKLVSPNTSDAYGYILNKERAAPAGVYLCTSVSSARSKWKKIGLHSKQVRVFYQGRQVEMYDSIIGYDNTSPYYWDTIIGTPANPVSSYIFAEYVGSGALAGSQPMSTFNKVKFPNNPRILFGNTLQVRVQNSSVSSTLSFPNSRGVDGANPNADAYIGSISETGVHTGIQNFRRTELWEINLLCVPGVTLSSVVAEIIDVCEQRSDCLGLIDTPLGLSVQEAVDWHNGQGVYSGDHSAFVTNKAACYYPWVKQYDPYTSSDIWLPPTAVVPSVIAYSDYNGEVWFAPAGINRGIVPNARAVETVVSRGDMDLMYGPGNGNALNPIAQFPRDGIAVYGQRTLQRTPSALDRVNVRRLMFYIEKTVASSCRKMVFEQDDPILWAQFKALIRPFLDDLVGRRAIEWYEVVCDETTNTPQRRNNNEVLAKVYVIPVKTGEKILLDFALLPSGANVQEFIAADLGQ